jgi:hypothetical protein
MAENGPILKSSSRSSFAAGLSTTRSGNDVANKPSGELLPRKPALIEPVSSPQQETKPPMMLQDEFAVLLKERLPGIISFPLQ